METTKFPLGQNSSASMRFVYDKARLCDLQYLLTLLLKY